MAIPSIRKNAPYVYLAEFAGDPNNYHLFVCIPVHKKTKVEQVSPNSTFFKIIDDENVEKEDFYYQRILIPKPQPDDGQRGSPQITTLMGWASEFAIREEQNVLGSRTISVDVSHESHVIDGDTKPSYQIVLLLEDAHDEGNTPIPNGVNPFLPYRPYLYLTNPNAEIGVPDSKFTPRVIVPTDLRTPLENINQSNVSIDSARGTFVETISLDVDAPRAITSTTDTEIQSNQEESDYTDIGVIGGFFEFTIIYNGLARKGKVRNRSSDRRPNGFMDKKQIARNLNRSKI